MSGVAEVFERLEPVPSSRRRAPTPSAPPTPAPVPLPPKRFDLLSGDDLSALPRMRWAVRGVIPASGVAALYGPSTTGKSFLALDLAAAIGEGRDWFGQRVPCARPVVYVALEGEAGFRARKEALEVASGRKLPENVRFVLQSFEVGELPDILALYAAITALRGEADEAAPVIIIDTLNRSAPSADENTSADMGRILEGVRSLQGLTDGVVLLVHHTGKDATKGMRGHSSLFAALDAAIEVSRTDDRREWKVAKAKDDEDGQVHPFRLNVVDLGEDEDGWPVNSCSVEPITCDESAAARPKLPKGGNQRIVYDALGSLFRESHTFGKGGAPAIRPCVLLDDAVAHARGRLTVPSERRTERTRQAITGLVSSGVMGCNEGWLWLN